MKEKIITRTILIVSFVSLFTDIASEMLYPVMPVYLRSIGFSVLLIGVLEGLAEATAGLSKGYFGNLSDSRQQRVPFIRGGYVLSALSKPMMAIFIFPVWIFFARTIDRLGKGIRTSARDAMLSDEASAGNKGKVFGFHRSMDTIGAAIGPFIALIWLFFYPGSYRWLFIIAFVPGIIAILLTLMLKDKLVKESPVKKPGFLSYFGYWKKAPLHLRRLFVCLLAFTLFNSSDAFLLLALDNSGMTDTWIIGLYIFYNLTYALLAYPFGILADRIGLKTLLISGLFIFSLVYFFFGFATSTSFFIVLFFFYGAYAAATEGISKAMITNMAEKKDTATAIGFFQSFASILAMIASSLAGFIWFTWGPQYMFIISGSAVLVITFSLAIILRNYRSVRSEEAAA